MEAIMKKLNKGKVIGLAVPVVIFAVVIVTVALKYIGKKPFNNLKAGDIYSVKIRLIPPDKTIEVDGIQELVDILKEVVVYERDDSYKEYAGQSVIYTVKMKDGSETVIDAYNPFIVIDGLGYKTQYGPCEELTVMANELLQGK